eukprot:579368-Hanusia_phi.AAC.3
MLGVVDDLTSPKFQCSHPQEPRMKLPPPPQPSSSKGATHSPKGIDEIEEVDDGISSEASSERDNRGKSSKKDGQGDVDARGRSLSFDDLYQLAPLQDGLSLQSAFAFEPLEGDDTKAFRRSASLDGIYALAEAMIRESEDQSQIMDLAKRLAEEGNVLCTDFEIESASTAEEDDSPAERLFGKERANELRKRITKSKNVTPQAAREALDAATAAMLGSDSTETIEFVTWFRSLESRARLRFC